MAQFLRSYWYPILSGILVGTSYIPFPPWAAGFCFVPLWLWWREQKNFSRIFWGGWLCQYLFTLIGFNWVAYTIHEFGNLPWPIAIVALLLFCGFANLHIPLAGIVWYALGRGRQLSPPISAFGLVGFTLLAEMLYPMIFDWHMGYTWYYLGWPAFHLAEWIGFQGLSALTLALNGAVFYALVRPQKRKHVAVVAVMALILFNFAGAWLKHSIPTPDREANVIVVQANIGNSEKQAVEHEATYRDEILDTFFNLTKEALAESGRPDFAVWPETAFPHILDEPYRLNSSWGHRLRIFLNENQLPLITGGYGYRALTRQVSNSLFLFDNSGQPSDTPYSKTRLLAFGEYFPGAQWFPSLYKLVPEVGSFARGGGPEVKSLNDIRIGPMICYESLFPGDSRKLGLLGAQILVNLTNDSWYGSWAEPYQHMYMTLARAVELRRPLVRSTNTGISTVALADGTILERSPLYEPWYGTYKVPYRTRPKKTVFMSWGFYFSWVIAAAMIICFLGAGRRARIEHP